MKKIFLLISVILFIFPVQAQHTLRLMTYNIKNANGMDDICSFQRGFYVPRDAFYIQFYFYHVVLLLGGYCFRFFFAVVIIK